MISLAICSLAESEDELSPESERALSDEVLSGETLVELL
jgi:hypothetical protein